MVRAVVVAITIVLAACSAPKESATRGDEVQRSGVSLPRPILKDSTGVQIFEYPTLSPVEPPITPSPLASAQTDRSGLAQAFALDSTPYLVLGGLKSKTEEEFNPRGAGWLSATELSDGTIVVKDVDRLMFHSPNGILLRTAGRVGDGPAEFVVASDICAVNGDTLVVISHYWRRASIWDATGRHVRTFQIAGEFHSFDCGQRRMVVKTGVASGSGHNVRYALFDLDGKQTRSLGELPGRVSTLPIVREPTILVVGDDVQVADAQSFSYRLYDAKDRLLKVVRFGHLPSLVTDENWKQLKYGFMGPNPDNRAAMERATSRKPERFPAYADVMRDETGRIWIADYSNASNLTVFSSTGYLLGRLRLPGSRGVTLVGAYSDHVILRESNATNGPSLKFYRMRAASNN